MATKTVKERLAEFRKALKQDAKEIRAEFEGEYGDELQELYGLSKQQIDALTPDSTDLETYAQLIQVVKLASRHNLTQAQLKEQIVNLGDTAVSIAKMSARLASLFV
jgi:oligoendopeptidase F